jgi:hypothetical protein
LAQSDASARVGPRVADHGFEHLGGDDDGLGPLPGEFDGALLHFGDLLEGHLHAEVAAGDHDEVERGDDLVQVLDGLGLLDLGDDGQVHVFFVHDLVDAADVVGGAHEGEGDHVDADAEGPAEVVFVFLAEGGDADGDAGETDALVIGDAAADLDAAGDVGVGDVGDGELHVAIVDEQRVAGVAVSGETVVGGGGALDGARDGVGGDDEPVSGAEDVFACAEGAEPDLGALEIGEDADGPFEVLGRRLDVGERSGMDVVGAVAEIETGDVHAGVDEVGDGFDGVGGRAEGGHDLRQGRFGSESGFGLRHCCSSPRVMRLTVAGGGPRGGPAPARACCLQDTRRRRRPRNAPPRWPRR